MAQKVPKMPENGQKSCTKEKNGSNKWWGRKSKKQSKLLCSSENIMFDFNLERIGFKIFINFTLKIAKIHAQKKKNGHN